LIDVEELASGATWMPMNTERTPSNATLKS
jgi:hypothetical protein